MRALLSLLLLLLAAPALAQERAAPLVLAAASLQEAMTDAADVWAGQGHPRPVLSFAASSALARQIVAGGRADLFASADADWMDEVERRGRIVPGTRAVLARNRLVVVARPGTPDVSARRGAALARRLGGAPLAMADPAAVPAGKYGEAALRALGTWDAVSGRVVRAENVRAALVLVERGAAPYGIVYATDARASAKVRVAGVFPRASHPPIVYPVARLTDGPAAREAEGFRRFLLSRSGQTILARRGFVPR
ncbi:molybdate ABC transporter substrate-binding protein [Sphingomonas sp. BK580]|uniref:molybdate ABC transporter substrate-binding protein n=1 Tax=Sphingomonas sp. BK580 TaxID=2586972 RepID=UPI0016174591|nr:molybdate ABC transporter substrate-binding protein [Sphingomonas sp. BK580]MBB3692308.1 molybdate transport system substrate-binding protein [Sphingomonas sp. BK580]